MSGTTPLTAQTTMISQDAGGIMVELLVAAGPDPTPTAAASGAGSLAERLTVRVRLGTGALSQRLPLLQREVLLRVQSLIHAEIQRLEKISAASH